MRMVIFKMPPGTAKEEPSTTSRTVFSEKGWQSGFISVRISLQKNLNRKEETKYEKNFRPQTKNAPKKAA